MLPPCRPASPFESSSPSVATPTTPTIGRAGKLTRSFMWMTPSSTRKRRVTGERTWSISCPNPGMSVATPHSIGLTSRISATSESPGSAPLTATGPVALLIRDMSISVTRSSSLRIWPVKQSFVSKTTVSPGSTSRTGSRSGPNDQITWSRDSRCCTHALRHDGLVLDVHAVDVAQPPRREQDDADREHDPERRPRDRDPVRVLDRIGRRQLVELVVEREEEQHDPAERHHQVEQGIERAALPAQVVPHAANADEHVHEDHERHRPRRDEVEAEQLAPLQAYGDRVPERDEGEDREHHPLKDPAPVAGRVVRVERLDVQVARVREEHPERERAEDRDLEGAEDHTRGRGEADVAVREQEHDRRHQQDPDP